MLNLTQLAKFLGTFLCVLLDVLTVFRTGLRSRGALTAENLFLRKQLALYLERKEETKASDRCSSVHHHATREVL
jgi:hypothetical protein